MEAIEELQSLLDEVAVEGARDRLLERGAAWSLFRQDGALPEDAPHLGDGIETDILGAQRRGLDALFIGGGIHGAELKEHPEALENLFKKTGASARAAMPALGRRRPRLTIALSSVVPTTLPRMAATMAMPTTTRM